MYLRVPLKHLYYFLYCINSLNSFKFLHFTLNHLKKTLNKTFFIVLSIFNRLFWYIRKKILIDPNTDLPFPDKYHLFCYHKITEDLRQSDKTVENFQKLLKWVGNSSRVDLMKKTLTIFRSL